MSGRELYSHKLAEHVIKVFKELMPLNNYFHEFVEIEELAKAVIREDTPETPEEPINMVKAPDVDFMW